MLGPLARLVGWATVCGNSTVLYSFQPQTCPRSGTEDLQEFCFWRNEYTDKTSK